MKHDEYPVHTFKAALAFEKWLMKNYENPIGIWIRIARLTSLWRLILFFVMAGSIGRAFSNQDGEKEREVDEDLRAFEKSFIKSRFSGNPPSGYWF